MKYGLFFVLSSLLWNQIYTCTTPLGQRSQCISLYDCPPLLAAFEQRPLSSAYLRFLKLSQCGFDGITPQVCCGPLGQPPETSTPQSSRPVWPATNTESNSNSGEIDPVNSEDSAPAPRDQCGIDYSDRIFGGQITDLDEFPWMALLGYRTRSGNVSYQCGGVLINSRYVLTAAHCVTGQIEQQVGSLVTVRLGEYDTQQDVDCDRSTCAPRPQDIAAAGGYPHPGYSDKNINRQDDIALVRLARRVRLSDYVKPICLTTTDAELDVGDSAFVAGWGRTLSGKKSPVKLKLGLPIFDKNDCLNKYRPLGAELSEKQLCAGGAYAQDSCKGDSGGPLMRKLSNGIWETIGVVSFGNGCGRDGWPGVYTSVASYDDWIRSTMRSTNK
ncbi:serine protease 7-like [Hyposmocoma kahamanoa]|uniref:serine protease 7-like n=1 Tax=Hyposmocoma kahamanoa TaxID=1477025 RepID=UPI000E6D6D69|nr:serine protease 7-like [Hyposmocoma kahamanoa]